MQNHSKPPKKETENNITLYHMELTQKLLHQDTLRTVGHKLITERLIEDETELSKQETNSPA